MKTKMNLGEKKRVDQFINGEFLNDAITNIKTCYSVVHQRTTEVINSLHLHKIFTK